jgi:hypothetical protein
MGVVAGGVGTMKRRWPPKSNVISRQPSGKRGRNLALGSMAPTALGPSRSGRKERSRHRKQ